MIKIYIVDHHMTERLGLHRVLDRATDMQIVGEVHSPAEALEQLSSMDVDVVLADVRMDEMSGAAFTRRLKAECPDVAVLIVTSFDDMDRNVELVEEAGADGFLSKDLVPDGLVRAVRRAAGGEPFFEER